MPEGGCEGFQGVGMGGACEGWMGGERFEGAGGKGVIGEASTSGRRLINPARDLL